MSELLLGLGTNLGDRRENLRRAVIGLAERVDIKAVAPLYETEPWGVTEQPPFLNTCVAAETSLPAQDLLRFIKDLERELGRGPSVRWGPRLIDIDILFYGDQILHGPELHVPHPGIAERAFVLAPLANLASTYRHPETGITVEVMLDAIDTSGVRSVVEPLFSPEESAQIIGAV